MGHLVFSMFTLKGRYEKSLRVGYDDLKQLTHLFSFHGVSFVELYDGRALGRVVQVQSDLDALLVTKETKFKNVVDLVPTYLPTSLLTYLPN